MSDSDFKIGVIGLGYVGLPLAVEFGRYFTTIGFDIDQSRIDELNEFFDRTSELSSEDLKSSELFTPTTEVLSLRDCNIFIITVPTPINKDKSPDLNPLINASETIGSLLKRGDIVVYESTVFPGCTEEICVPILEKFSGLSFNLDFFCGYSPERINPGDKQRTLTNIKKIVSGSNDITREILSRLYGTIIKAGIYAAESIKVAEAAKVIENTQRDLNIALINEFSIIFNMMNIDTKEVLKAAGTKWNFLPFQPGLVGGHCIGVDPYYLTHKALQLGYNPKVILSGREINDNMSSEVVERLLKALDFKKISKIDFNILILGLTFKENCPDIRNTKVVDVIHEISTHTSKIKIHDPLASKNDIQKIIKYDFIDLSSLELGLFDAILLTVPHEYYLELGSTRLKSYLKPNGVFFDLKGIFQKKESDLRL